MYLGRGCIKEETIPSNFVSNSLLIHIIITISEKKKIGNLIIEESVSKLALVQKVKIWEIYKNIAIPDTVAMKSLVDATH